MQSQSGSCLWQSLTRHDCLLNVKIFLLVVLSRYCKRHTLCEGVHLRGGLCELTQEVGLIQAFSIVLYSALLSESAHLQVIGPSNTGHVLA